MNIKLLFLILVTLIAGSFTFSSCSDEYPTFGTLTITVYNPATGSVVAGEKLYLATSLSNLKQGIYLYTERTNSLGLVYFGNLAPGFYFYDTENWEDYGATNIYAGVDFFVHLYVNTPGSKKK
ncbi:MAG: hypothetical protein WCK84_08585 [Bacteroidota bacterium]